MEKGTVKWFNNAKGFGFIRSENGGDDIFAHYSTIKMEGYRTLKAGQPVQFETHQGEKGRHTSLVMLIDNELTSNTNTSEITPTDVPPVALPDNQ